MALYINGKKYRFNLNGVPLRPVRKTGRIAWGAGVKNITINRIVSSYGTTGSITLGDSIYLGDELEVTVEPYEGASFTTTYKMTNNNTLEVRLENDQGVLSQVRNLPIYIFDDQKRKIAVDIVVTDTNEPSKNLDPSSDTIIISSDDIKDLQVIYNGYRWGDLSMYYGYYKNNGGVIELYDSRLYNYDTSSYIDGFPEDDRAAEVAFVRQQGTYLGKLYINNEGSWRFTY